MESKPNIKNHLFKNLTDAAILLAIASGMLFIVGRAIYIGFYEYWGISAVFATATFQEVLYTGYLSLHIGIGKLIVKVFYWIIGIFIFMRIIGVSVE